MLNTIYLIWQPQPQGPVSDLFTAPSAACQLQHWKSTGQMDLAVVSVFKSALTQQVFPGRDTKSRAARGRRKGWWSSEESGLVAAPVPPQGSVAAQPQQPPPHPAPNLPKGDRAPTSDHTTICSHSNTKTAQTTESTEVVSRAHSCPAPVTSL